MFSTLSDLQVEADGSCCIRESLGAGQTPSGQELLNNFSGALALASAVRRANVSAVGGTYESENRKRVKARSTGVLAAETSCAG